MRPILFEVLGFGMPTHEFFVGLGVAVAGLVYALEARRRGVLGEQSGWVVVGAPIGGAIFRRVGSGWRFVGPRSTVSELYLYRAGRSSGAWQTAAYSQV